MFTRRQSKWHFLLVLSLTTALGGCIDLLDESAVFLAGIGDDDQTVYLQHFDEWSGWVTLPSTLWGLDLPDGEERKILSALVQYDVQAAGDYVVAERPTADGQGSRIIAYQISTDQETTVLERDIELGGRYDRAFVLDGERVIARTDTGLLVHDLSGVEAPKAIPVSDSLVEILTAGGSWALVVRDNLSYGNELLVNLDSGEIVDVPDEPANHQALFFDAVFVDEYMFTAAYTTDGQGQEVLALHIPTLTWETIAEYAAPNTSQLAERTVAVRGADANLVVVSVFTTFQSARLDLIDRASGQRTRVPVQTGFLSSPVQAVLHDQHLYWVDDGDDLVVVYDIATEQRNMVPYTLK